MIGKLLNHTHRGRERDIGIPLNLTLNKSR